MRGALQQKSGLATLVSSLKHGQVLERLVPMAFTPSIKLFTAAKEMTVRDTLNSAIDEGMSTYPKVFLMGEEYLTQISPLPGSLPHSLSLPMPKKMN